MISPIASVNPLDGSIIQEYSALEPHQVEAAIAQAHHTQQDWQKLPFTERAGYMNALAELLEQRKESLAELMAQEMGKPLKQGLAEAEKCALVCRFYAKEAEGFLQPTIIETEDYSYSAVHYEPLGVILAVMPWNFPLWQVFRCLAPNLMGGNTLLLKHASNVPGCALAIHELVHDAGFPKGCFQSLLIGSDAIEGMLADERIAAASLTGSNPAGEAIAQIAGKHVKKCVLELGGSDPYVILADADVELAAEACAESRFQNSGQSCIAAKRFIVVPEIAEAFTNKVVEYAKSRKVGDPLDEATDIGPMARTDLRDELHEQVEASVEAGAECLIGGEHPQDDSAFYPATVLDKVKPAMRAFDEELFGPVAVIVRAKDEADAIKLANDTPFGLGAGIFSNHEERARSIAIHQLQAGNVFVNDYVKSNPKLPFGGIKQSGYGRELARNGLLEFMNAKTIAVK